MVNGISYKTIQKNTTLGQFSNRKKKKKRDGDLKKEGEDGEEG